MSTPSIEMDDEEQECGYSFDHDIEITHEDETGTYWTCLNCGAEGFPDDDDYSLSPEAGDR